MSSTYLTLPRDSNQARGLARYALDFLAGKFGPPGAAALARTEQFHTDSVACAVSALAEGANAPCLLREEALSYPCDARYGAVCFGSDLFVQPEKAVVANCSAVRELDSNGTNFGYNPRTGAARGEFGHNDFYPVVLAAAGQAGWNGERTLAAMLCLDEIRGRLAEVFGLKDYKVDHVLHGAIASAAVYGAILGATEAQIESAIGLVVAHHVPFRAIRHGEQLSDSKGASAAISSEAAVVAMRRAMRGFIGPADIFRNPQAVFCLFEKPPRPGESPFDLELTTSGDDFAVLGMHFKLGLYEHQSAGAVWGLIELLERFPGALEDAAAITGIKIRIYEPAYSIIGDPHKRNPTTRQSADHSMVYIIATTLRKALERKTTDPKRLMLAPADYDEAALFDPLTRSLMDKIVFEHGGAEFDRKYPDGIPTTIDLEHAKLGRLESGFVMYPEGHARASHGRLADLLAHKFQSLAGMGVDDVTALEQRLTNLKEKSAEEIGRLYAFPLRVGR